MTYSHVQPSNVIGWEDDKEKIIKLLLQDRNRNCEKVCRDTVGNHLLRVLLSRSFLTDFLDYGRDCTFKLHDLVHDLAVYVAKGEFQIIYPGSPKISKHAQHLRFIENNLLGQALLPSGLKTIIFPMEATNEAFLNTLVSRCKYLRVLDLPFSIGKLKHLRYLGLEELPEWLSALICLKQLGIIFCPKLLSYSRIACITSHTFNFYQL
ncbi:hypothetical protein CR513_57083, partial [Mucuna pruriens]